jgi:hypothetical protein
MSRPSCFKNPASFITQNGELSALTADQAMTNFSALTGLRSNTTENARTAIKADLFISSLLQTTF